MRYSDVNEKYIYLIDFEPVRACEFNEKHLAIVLKKNTDKKTAIVVPLTTNPSGDGKNKVSIGKIPNLPNNLRTRESYLVYDQIRTVNCNRFSSLIYNSNNTNSSKVSDDIFTKILFYCLNNLIEILSVEERVEFLHNIYVDNLLSYITNIAYDIKKLKNKVENIDAIKSNQSKIANLLTRNIDYTSHIKQVDIDNGILEIIVTVHTP